MTAAVATRPAAAAGLREGDGDGRVLEFIAGVFDRPERPSFERFLPVAGDRLWSWTGPDGDIEAALLSRRWRMADGLPGVNVGFVCTRPDRRRGGVASALVGAVLEIEESRGAAFAQVWARDYLTGFYQKLGFRRLAREDYVELMAGSGPPVTAPAPLAEANHAALDRIRRGRPDALARELSGNRWTGINPAFPWAARLEVVKGVHREDPEWYAVIARGDEATSILEYGGDLGGFPAAAAAVAASTGKTVRANFTDDALGRAAADAVATEAGPPYYRFLRSRLLDAGAAPQTTWLDRI